MDLFDIVLRIIAVLLVIVLVPMAILAVIGTVWLIRDAIACMTGEEAETSEEPVIATEDVEIDSSYGAGAVTDTEDDECYFTYEEVEALAKVLYRECRGNPSTMEKSAVAWCVLNRVDNPHYPDTIIGVLEAPNQFAYNEDTPVTDELKALAIDVLNRWYDEKNGVAEVGRTLPNDYYYFIGDGEHNYFTQTWKGTDYWDWSLDNPYEN